MSSLTNKRNLLFQAASCAFVCMIMAVAVWAQDISTQTVQHGPSSFETRVRNAEVVYVDGNDLILKVDNGRVEHLVVPESDKFHVDGREVSVYDLKPGMKLTETILTTSIPRYVNTVRTIEGKVWHVNAPHSVIVTLPDHKNVQYKVPSHAEFTVNGQKKTIFDLKKGMQFSATIITDEPETVLEHSKHVVAEAPPSPELPRRVGALLFLTPGPTEPTTMASAEQLPEELPKTGSLLPLIGLLGTLATMTSFGVRAIRRFTA